jgi:aminoglycoside 2''-phosphotransferase
MTPRKVQPYIELIRRHLPAFAFERAIILQARSQFNNVLCIDDAWIFRFPKSAGAAADLVRELLILPRLLGKLPLPIPAPEYHAFDGAGELLFMAYRRLPGEPLLREKYAQLRHDESIVDQIAQDMALFLRRLHRIPPREIGLASKGESAREEWARIYADIEEQLYPHMRMDARAAVARSLELALADDDLWRFEACLIHGDFGTGNLLYSAGRLGGVIDFGFCGIGDPAQDLGALLASYGESFVARVLQHYPALGAGLRRARFYQSNYALIQALYALRDGDDDEFEDGMRDYI